MSINVNGNNSLPEFIKEILASGNKQETPKTDLSEKIIFSDSVKINILNKQSPIPAKAKILGKITSDSQTIEREIVFSQNYKSGVTSLVTGLHQELKAINKITPKQLNEIRNFDLPHREMFIKSLQELESLKNGKTNAADYMINIMKYAADLSGNDRKKFVDLVGEMFSDIPIPLDIFRKILGAGPHSAGNLLEPMLDKIVEKQGGSFGFNSNITDDIDKNNTMTHHAGEFLQIGYNRGGWLGKLAADAIDRNTGFIQSKLNEGDIRSGYFSSMVGSALKKNIITPHDAVKLFKWAFTTSHGGKEPPLYGSKETQGNYLKWGDYKIENWVSAYNRAFPNDPIR